LSFGQVEGFFVDACVLLPHSIDSIRQSCFAFLRENATRCLLSSSVKTEALDLIERSYDTIVSDLKLKLKPFLDSKEIKDLSNRSGRILAQFFMERRRALRKGFKSEVPREIVGTIENYVASRLHSLRTGEKIPVDNFLAALLTEISIKKHALQAPFNGIKGVDVTPNNSVISLIVMQTMMQNDKDVRHLASALNYQFQNNRWVIFVTTDDSDILSKEQELFSVFTLQCSSPEWASDYYDDMTKLKAPREHFREIKDYSSTQKEFAAILEKSLTIKMIE
jgi:hypothetical protein